STLRVYVSSAAKPVCILDKERRRQFEWGGFFSPDAKWLMLPNGKLRDGDPRASKWTLLEVATGKAVAEMPLKATNLYFTFAPSANRMAWYDPQGTIHVFDAGIGNEIWQLDDVKMAEDQERFIPRLVFSPD